MTGVMADSEFWKSCFLGLDGRAPLRLSLQLGDHWDYFLKGGNLWPKEDCKYFLSMI